MRVDAIVFDRVAGSILVGVLFYFIVMFDMAWQDVLLSHVSLDAVVGVSSLCVSLLGFIVAIVIFLLGSVEAKAFEILRASRPYREFWTAFKGAMIACAVSSAIGMLSIFALWLKLYSAVLLWLLLSSLVWLMLRVARIMWILHLIIDAEVARGAGTRRKLEE